MFSLTIIKVHLVQLLWFLFDADSQRWGAAVLLQGWLPSFWHFGVLLGPWAGAAAADRLGWCHAVGRREGSIGRGGGLRGRGGGGAAGLVEAGLLVAPGSLLDDGDMRDRGLGALVRDCCASRKALGEGWWRQVVQFGAGARRGRGWQRGRLGCQSLLADRVSPTDNTRPEVRGHPRGHDLWGEVWLWVQGQGGTVLSAHKGGVVVIVRLRLYCWNWEKTEEEKAKWVNTYSNLPASVSEWVCG